MSTKRDDLILNLETLAANAWPAAEVAPLDGWRMRHADGVTRRANSVWPNRHDGAMKLAAKVDAAEHFYRQRKLPTIFQICDAMRPPQLEAFLAARGYGIAAPTDVQTSPIERLLRATVPRRDPSDIAAQVREILTDDWFDLYCASEEVSGHPAAVRRKIMERIEPTRGFALLCWRGASAAVGLGVVENGWLGIFSMATLPAFRRRGAARALLYALAEWGRRHGANSAYLQVMQDNGAAQQLYADAGFASTYRYHYRIKRSA